MLVNMPTRGDVVNRTNKRVSPKRAGISPPPTRGKHTRFRAIRRPQPPAPDGKAAATRRLVPSEGIQPLTAFPPHPVPSVRVTLSCKSRESAEPPATRLRAGPAVRRRTGPPSPQRRERARNVQPTLE